MERKRIWIGVVELIIWSVALIALAIMEPTHEAHFTICPLANLGFHFCPGCGLGMSICYLLHFDVVQSFHAHPLGIVAFVILVFRIISIIRLNIKINRPLNKATKQ
jgi:hypothetical protein